MRFVLVLCTSLLMIFGFGHQAQAQQSCEVTLYYGVASSYGFQDIGETIYDRPVGQGGATRSCGRWSVDVYTTTALSSEGRYGNRHGGDEIDLTVTWADSVNSPVGALEVEVSAAYWMISDFGTTSDDFVALTVRVGRPFSLGARTTITPYMALDRWMELSGNYDTNLRRAGATLTHEFSDRWSVELDMAHVTESRDRTRTWRGDFHVSRSFNSGWTLTGSVLAAERMDTVVGVSVSRAF